MPRSFVKEGFTALQNKLVHTRAVFIFSFGQKMAVFPRDVPQHWEGAELLVSVTAYGVVYGVVNGSREARGLDSDGCRHQRIAGRVVGLCTCTAIGAARYKRLRTSRAIFTRRAAGTFCYRDNCSATVVVYARSLTSSHCRASPNITPYSSTLHFSFVLS